MQASFLRVTLITAAALTLSGCFVSEQKHANTAKEVENLKAELQYIKSSIGDFLFLGLDPELEMSISDVSFTPPETKYSSVEVKFRSNLKQTNDEFPLQNYYVSITYAVLNDNGNEIGDFTFESKMENGVLALAEEQVVYGLKAFDTEGFKLAAKSYNWYPAQKFIPKKI